MKALKPRIEITLDIINISPAEAAEIQQIAEGMDLKTEWVRGDIAAVIYFENIESYKEFLRLMPLCD